MLGLLEREREGGMMEIIDKLYLELSLVSKAKTKRELELESVIQAALNIKDLWLPYSGWDAEHEGEAKALIRMRDDFYNVLGKG